MQIHSPRPNPRFSTAFGGLRTRLAEPIPGRWADGLSDRFLAHAVVSACTGAPQPITSTDLEFFSLTQPDVEDPVAIYRVLGDQVSSIIRDSYLDDRLIRATAHYLASFPDALSPYASHTARPRSTAHAEVGCSTKGFFFMDSPHTILIDINAPLTRLLRAYARLVGSPVRVHTRDISLGRPPLQDRASVSCSYVLHCLAIEDIRPAVTFLSRLLSPEGTLFVRDPRFLCCTASPEKIAVIRAALQTRFKEVQEEESLDFVKLVPLPTHSFTATGPR